MANKRIKGITIELDGNTQKLENALKNVEKSSKDVQSELKEIDKSLKFNPKDVELLTQKQDRLKEAISLTEQELSTLKTASEQAYQKLQETGEGQKEFDAITREIKRAENQIDSFKNSLDKVDKEFDEIGEAANDSQSKISKMGEDLKSAVQAGVFMEAGSQLKQGFAEAGEKLKEVSGLALEQTSKNTKIDIQLDIDAKGEKTLKESLKTVQSYGFDGQEALDGVLRLWKLNGDATDEQKQKIADMAGAIGSVFSGLDFQEVIQESFELANSLGISQEEALGMTDALLKMGFPPEQLDIITEYGTQLDMAGYSAEEIQAIFAAGIDTGTWNIDNLMDGIKEGRIKMSEFGAEIPKALDPLIEKAGWSREEFQKFGQDIAAGGELGKEALRDVAYMLGEVDDKTLQNELGVQLFGTKWEDQGVNILNTILGVDDNLKSMAESQAGVNSTVEQMKADPAVRLQEAMITLKDSLLPIIEPLANIVASIAEWMTNNPTLVTTIMAIVTAIGTLMPIITAVIAITTVVGGAMMGTIAIIGLVIAAVVGIATAIALNWNKIKDKTVEVFSSIGTFLSDKWNGIKSTASSVWEGIKNAISTPIEAARDKIKSVIDSIKGFFSFKFKWPSIPMPHFGISPRGWKIGDLLKGSIPKLGIDWYAQGGIFDNPSLIGVGEAGSEAVVPTHKLDKFLEEGVNRVLNRVDGNHGQGIVINVNEMNVRDDNDIRLLAEEVLRRIDLKTNRKANAGGLA